jgi:hypothetical protein
MKTAKCQTREEYCIFALGIFKRRTVTLPIQHATKPE